MLAARILCITLLATTITGQSELSTSSPTLESSELMFRKTEIATFAYKNRLLRVWASNSNRYDVTTSQWQFHYDPLLIPMTDDQGQLVVTTEQFGDSWRTSFTLVLDDEAARRLAFDSVSQAYKNVEGLLPSNTFAIPIKSMAIRIPDLTGFHPEVSLLGHQPCPPETACYPFHGLVSSVRVTVSSPSRTTANEIESLIPKCQIYFEITRSGFRKQISSSPVTVTFQALRDSYFYTELSIKHSADYVSKFDLKRILQISRQTLGKDLKAEEEEGFDSGILEQLWKRWTVVASDDFWPHMWTQTYNAGQSRVDVVSDALNDIFIFDKRDEKFALNFNSAKNHDLLLFSSDGYANKRFTKSELKRYLEDDGICIDFDSNKIIMRTLDFVKVTWSDLTDPNTLSQSLFTYLPFQVEKESGFIDFSSFRAKRSTSSEKIITAPELLEKHVKQLLEDNKDLKKRQSLNEESVKTILTRLEDLENGFKNISNIMVSNQDLLERMCDLVNSTETTQVFKHNIKIVPVGLSNRDLSTTVEDNKDLKKCLSQNEDYVYNILTRLENLETTFNKTNKDMVENLNLLDRIYDSVNFTKRMYVFEKTMDKVSVSTENLSIAVEKLSMSTETRLEGLNFTVTSELTVLMKRLSSSDDNVYKIFNRLEDLETGFRKYDSVLTLLTTNFSTSVEKLSISTETRLEEINLTVTSELRDKKSIASQLFETLSKALTESWLCKPEWKLLCNSKICNCYFFVEGLADWHKALHNCRRLGGDLASIHSDEESEFIGKLFNASIFGAWIGLNDEKKEGRFEWTDGSPVDFTNWNPLLNPFAMALGTNRGRDATDWVFIANGKWLDSKSLEGTGLGRQSVCQEPIKQIRSPESFMKDLSIKLTNRQIQNLGKAVEHSVCGRGWKLHCDSISCNCYFYELKIRSWGDALSNCRTLGSDLISIHSYDEMRFVKELVGVRGNSVWIGLTKKVCEGKFTWSDGTPLDFLYWHASAPNEKCTEHCGGLNFVRTWSGKDCEGHRESVCKRKIPKTP